MESMESRWNRDGIEMESRWNRCGVAVASLWPSTRWRHTSFSIRIAISDTIRDAIRDGVAVASNDSDAIKTRSDAIETAAMELPGVLPGAPPGLKIPLSNPGRFGWNRDGIDGIAMESRWNRDGIAMESLWRR